MRCRSRSYSASVLPLWRVSLSPQDQLLIEGCPVALDDVLCQGQNCISCRTDCNVQDIVSTLECECLMVSMRLAGAQEFKKSFDDAVSKNTELLGEDAGDEETAETTEAKKEKAPATAADKLAEDAEKLKVEENGKE